MSKSIVRLFAISSPALGSTQFSGDGIEKFGPCGDELRLLLSDVNGFYTFESALHVFPAVSHTHFTDLQRWNQCGLWKDRYRQDLASLLCFAEDIFGGQFCIRDNAIWYFDPETGELEHISSTLEQWAKIVVENFESRTGFPLAHRWQQMHGPLAMGQRLVPKKPFVLGGEFELDNLMAYDSIQGMRLRGELARQIRELPDGSRVIYRIV